MNMPGVVALTFMSALSRQRQVNLCEFEASLVYVVHFRPARATQRNPVSKRKEQI